MARVSDVSWPTPACPAALSLISESQNEDELRRTVKRVSERLKQYAPTKKNRLGSAKRISDHSERRVCVLEMHIMSQTDTSKAVRRWHAGKVRRQAGALPHANRPLVDSRGGGDGPGDCFGRSICFLRVARSRSQAGS